jgi:hypothetical protein
MQQKIHGLLQHVLNRQSPVELVHFVSFPKSGRTWIETIVAKLYEELASIPVEQVLAHLEEFAFRERFRYTNRLTGKVLPFVFFSHGFDNIAICQGTGFPQEQYQDQRIIIMVRDPRDVVVSHYHFERWRMKAFDGGISEFIRYPYAQAGQERGARFGIRPVINYMNAFLEHSSVFAALHVMYYEDLKQDTLEQVRLLTEFLGIHVEEHILTQAVEFGCFDNMRQMEMNSSLNWYGLEKPEDLKGLKTRKGQVGSYREELGPDDIAYIDCEIQQHLNPFFARYKRNS